MNKPDWAAKVCPPFTQAALIGQKMRAAQSTVELVGNVAPVKQGMEVVTCVGPSCMWFIPTAAEDGTAGPGNCAMTLAPLAANQQAMATNVIAGTLQRLAPTQKE